MFYNEFPKRIVLGFNCKENIRDGQNHIKDRK